jgi:hypothetical protein
MSASLSNPNTDPISGEVNAPNTIRCTPRE